MNSLLNYDTNNRSSIMDQCFRNLVDKLFEAEAEKANGTIGQTDSEKCARHVDADGGYKCIHLGIGDFIQQLQYVINELHLTPEQIVKTKFLDVGCGVGQKVYLAGCFGFNTFGLELRKELIETGRTLFDRLNADLRVPRTQLLGLPK